MFDYPDSGLSGLVIKPSSQEFRWSRFDCTSKLSGEPKKLWTRRGGKGGNRGCSSHHRQQLNGLRGFKIEYLYHLSENNLLEVWWDQLSFKLKEGQVEKKNRLIIFVKFTIFRVMVWRDDQQQKQKCCTWHEMECRWPKNLYCLWRW